MDRLGEKIRGKRIEAGMSLKGLAEKTGVTPGFLSQIERNITDPSITSLRKIAAAARRNSAAAFAETGWPSLLWGPPILR